MSRSKEKKRNTRKEDNLKTRTIFFITGVISLIFICAIAGLLVFTYKLLYRSDYFFIKDTRIDWESEPISPERYKRLAGMGMGENIFKFNISAAVANLSATYPELKDVRVTREFPNKLVIKMTPRVPVAQVGENSFFLVDKEGTVLTEPSDYIREDLPLLTGVGWRFMRKIGQKEDSTRMKNGLLLLKTIKDSGFLKNHILAKIDVSDYRNISFFIEDGLEIKIGHDNFEERLKELEKALATMTIDKNSVKYIDLRFGDIVLGLDK